MAEKKAKQKIITLPPGIAKWPRLGPQPDYGTDEFPKKDGEFNTKVIYTAENAEIVRKLLGPIHKEAIAAGRKAYEEKPKAKREKTPFSEHPFLTPVYDENEEPTGEFELSVKTKASGVNKKSGEKWTRSVPKYDASGNRMPTKTAIGGGSTIRVAITPDAFFMDATHLAGLSLRLEGVKVLDLVTGGERSASSLGFDEAEDGYSYSADDSEDEEDFDTAEEAGEAEESADEEDDF